MKRLLSLLFLTCCAASQLLGQQTIVVTAQGDDQADGTPYHPLKSLNTALQKAVSSTEPDIRILLKEGTYYLSSPLRILSADFAGRKLTLAAAPGEQVTVSGALPLSLRWKKTNKGYWQTKLNAPPFDQLIVNGQPQTMARYPNDQGKGIYHGTAQDALSEKRIKRWKHPEGGFIHALHSGEWGDMHYRITGKEKNILTYEGGHQNNRPSKMHPQHRFVENIFEELDAPGEWFYAASKQELSYYPPEGIDLKTATTEVAVLPGLIELRGTADVPLRNIVIENIRFAHTTRTFMEPYERLMRSDWCIYRGGALLLENTENCTIKGCEFTQLGGNAVFISKYNRLATVSDSYFHHLGASAVCLVGDTTAVRSPSMEYNEFVPLEKMDFTPGAANNRYPRECTVENNLMHHIGQVEKQVAGVEIQIAAHLQVLHNTIYQVPRAAINIGDGAFGGHLIAYNDAFETVLETSDHGAFNSWGRDRFWLPDYSKMCELVKLHPELILLDARYTTVLRNNRFRCDHGWDIDLDDGSSNYHIYNNLCLKGGLKLREGFFRTAENNILLNNSLHPHVWFVHSGDRVERNLLMRPYYPIGLQAWGERVDNNYFPSVEALNAAQQNKTDRHSLFGAYQFNNAPQGDFTLSAGSTAFGIGFENFPMDDFGVYSLRLKQLAAKPQIPSLLLANAADALKEHDWLGARIRYVQGLGERSAYGLPDEKGIILLEIASDSPLAAAGLQKGDVLRTANGALLLSVSDLFSATEKNRWTGKLPVEVFRNQRQMPFTLLFKK
ncbi:MAG: PDZ domain-containing protein [Bacteroides sp.]